MHAHQPRRPGCLCLHRHLRNPSPRVAITGPDADLYLSNAYWLTFTDDLTTICGIEAQWVP